MRDLVITLIFLIFLFRALKRPDIGLNLFCWVSLMNPHKLCWGFALTKPFAQLAALATLGALFTSKESKKVPWTPPSILLAIFLVWMFITTIFAMHPEKAWPELNLVWKIQLMTFLIMIIANTKERIQNLMWVIALSLAFYGVKGGIFTITSGGGARVWGPATTFIGGNNEIGLALNMTIPLVRYLQLTVSNATAKLALTGTMILSFFCVLGTQSRGALIGGAAMILFLVMKSRNKLPLLLVLAVSIPPILSFMPESWYARMNTVKTYQQDGSAMGRINAWHAAMNIATHRITGGGYKCLHFPDTFFLYAPNKWDVHDAHSVYFEVLGEHGAIGLGLFLSIAVSTWRLASKTRDMVKGNPEQKWIADLCAMIQVSFIGYFAGGAFLGLAMFDLYYDLVAVVVCCYTLARKQVGVPSVQTVTQGNKTPSKRSFIRPPVKSPADSFPRPVGRSGNFENT
jgi:probable O-glycosylation ligase (exosortase A-associated)